MFGRVCKRVNVEMVKQWALGIRRSFEYFSKLPNKPSLDENLFFTS